MFNEDIRPTSSSHLTDRIKKLPSLMVFGQKNGTDPMEEFWLNKLANVEKHYDEYMIHLEKALLENRVHGRLVTVKENRIGRLKGELEEKNDELQKISKTAVKLQKNLTRQKFESDSLNKRLAKTETISEKTTRQLGEERHERMRCERELSALRVKLGQLERDKKLLTHDVAVKKHERTRAEERERNLVEDKWTLLKNLSEMDTERRVQTTTNITLCESIGQLLHVGKSQEDRLLRQRNELEEILVGMQMKKKEHEDSLRKLGITEKQLHDIAEEGAYSEKKVDDLDRQVRHWKEELKFKEVEQFETNLEVGKLKSENSYLRCEVAQLREKLNRIQGEMTSLDRQMKKTETDLRTTKQHERAVNLVMCRNAILRDKINKKMQKQGFAFDGIQGRINSGVSQRNRNTTQNEIQSYKRKISELERQKFDLEKKINDSKRKENMYRLKLDRYSAMEEQILWTEKAMIRLEGDRKRMESMLKSFATNFPKKVPFQKLVTDPSILDRITKQKVLQQRLTLQSARIEEMKKTARKLTQYQKQRSEEDINTPKQLPQWKLAYWRQKKGSQETLFDFDDTGLSEFSQPLTERDYYKEYMNYLDEEIPNLKNQIFSMEKAQTRLLTRSAADEERQKERKRELEDKQDAEDSEMEQEYHLTTVQEEEEELTEEDEDSDDISAAQPQTENSISKSEKSEQISGSINTHSTE